MEENVKACRFAATPVRQRRHRPPFLPLLPPPPPQAHSRADGGFPLSRRRPPPPACHQSAYSPHQLPARRCSSPNQLLPFIMRPRPRPTPPPTPCSPLPICSHTYSPPPSATPTSATGPTTRRARRGGAQPAPLVPPHVGCTGAMDAGERRAAGATGSREEDGKGGITGARGGGPAAPLCSAGKHLPR